MFSGDNTVVASSLKHVSGEKEENALDGPA
jgi:hypothetical protein